MPLLLECLIGAVAGVGVIASCWRLRRPLDWARTYDARMTEDGLYGDLPIYGYLRRYLLVLLLSGFFVVLGSALLVILIFIGGNCGNGGTGTALALFVVLFGIHMSTIAWFETARHQHGKPYRIQALVDDVRKRLWRIAIVLLVTTIPLPFILWAAA